jgi:hypothetical protein
MKAALLVNTKSLTAFRACPALLLSPDELTHTESLDVLQVLDHAHAVFGPVALIKVF